MSEIELPKVHYRKLCRLCRRLIEQCRCIAAGKVTRYGICQRCAHSILEEAKRDNQRKREVVA